MRSSGGNQLGGATNRGRSPHVVVTVDIRGKNTHGRDCVIKYPAGRPIARADVLDLNASERAMTR